MERKKIHESSPGNRGASIKLKNNCKDYIPSQYFPDIESGTIHKNIRCENLESMSFEDESLDLHVTQDVLEHIFHPEKAFREISRTLKAGGIHIFTVAIVNKFQQTQIAAKINNNGDIEQLMEPEYHGNPVSDEGALVTYNGVMIS